MIRTKRIYDPVSADDGYRLLVDRLWPRGISKERADLDLWLKDVGPSAQLRQWYGHQPERFAEFKVRYEAELATNPAAATLLEIAGRQPVVTLLYGARSPLNEAVVLQEFLDGGAGPPAER